MFVVVPLFTMKAEMFHGLCRAIAFAVISKTSILADKRVSPSPHLYPALWMSHAAAL